MHKDFIDFLKESISITDVVSRKVKLRKVGHDLFGLCPFHSEKTGSLKVDPEKGLYYCFGCGAHGDIFSFIMDTEKIDFKDAVEYLANAFGIPMPKETHVFDKNQEIYKVINIIKEWFSEQLKTPEGEKAREYLKSRSILNESIEKFELGYAPEGRALQNYLFKAGYSEDILLKTGAFFKSENKPIYNRYHGRLIFPIFDAKSRCIGFGGRVLDNLDTAKYINSPESNIFIKNENLYGYQIAKKARLKEIMIVEGYLDVISLHQEGFSGALAPLGTAISSSQIEMCWALTDTPFIALDGDLAGQKASYRWCDKILPLLRPGKSFKFVRFPELKDPDELIRSGESHKIKESLDNALNLFEWLWEGALLFNEYDTPEKKASIIKNLLEKIETIKDLIVKKFYVYEIKKREKSFYKSSYIPKTYFVTPITPAKGRIEKFLIVTLLEHPYIINNVIEKFVEFNFSDPTMEKIKDKMLEVYNNFYDKSNFVEKIEEIKNLGILEDDKLTVSLTQKILDDNKIQEAWLAAFEEYFNMPNMRDDLQKAASSLKSTFSHDDWQKFKALKKESVLKNTKL